MLYLQPVGRQILAQHVSAGTNQNQVRVPWDGTMMGATESAGQETPVKDFCRPKGLGLNAKRTQHFRAGLGSFALRAGKAMS